MTDSVPDNRRRTTVAGDAVTLAAWSGSTTGPSVLFVHGYPDTHRVWDPVIGRLEDRFRCLTYDVRGAGESDVPAARDAYRLTHLLTDLVAVMDALSPDDPVHLVGHDWGSIQAWDAVVRAQSDPRLTGRIASFTSISGPCLQHVGAFAASARHAGWSVRSGGMAKKRAALRQARHSWYVYAFQVPVVPDLMLRRHNARLVARRTDPSFHFGPTLPDDSVNGLNLYRSNVFHAERVPGGAHTDLPVQLVVPLRDKYVTPALTQNVARFASDLTRVEIDAGHWVVRSRPDEIAGMVASFVTGHTTGNGAPARDLPA